MLTMSIWVSLCLIRHSCFRRLEYVLSKMQKLIDEYDVVCKEIIAIEPDLKSNVEQFEKSISISDDEKPSAASAQYANLRNYAL